MKGRRERLGAILKCHFHIVLYAYFWFGLFVCGLVAPDERVAALGSRVITRGWHLSALSVVLILPVPVLYILRMRGTASREEGQSGGGKCRCSNSGTSGCG